jgi:rare lipoprotein A (peptidoglycan hydrolase)
MMIDTTRQRRDARAVGLALGTLGFILVATLVFDGSPRSGAAVDGASEATRTAATPGAPAIVEVGLPLPAPTYVPDSAAATFGGQATWYCSASSACTRGYGPGDLVAAIDPTTGVTKGTRLRVHHQGRSVDVTVVDVCACGGDRVIDLTSGAFARLADLSRGVIDVTIEEIDRTPVAVGRNSATLPPTDTRSEP